MVQVLGGLQGQQRRLRWGLHRGPLAHPQVHGLGLRVWRVCTGPGAACARGTGAVGTWAHLGPISELALPGERNIRGLKAGEECQQVQNLVLVQYSMPAFCLSFPQK